MKQSTTIDKVSSIDDLKRLIKKYGFKSFWGAFIKTYLFKKRPDLQSTPSDIISLDMRSKIFDLDNIGELYEISLEYINQISKKELGQYYTPKDVSHFMAQKTVSLFDEKLDCLADACCGTGNLIIEVLSALGNTKAQEVISGGRLYLYDIDETAIYLALMKIAVLFVGKGDSATYSQLKSLINMSVGNFLESTITLPKNCILISNPPYGKIPNDMSVWAGCESRESNDMYGVFIEKIAKQAKGAVIISPQSFLGSGKFASLRRVLSNHGGEVYSFDNIPCPIFTGRKKGIFNTNKANSVRAAITVIDNKEKGFRVSPMIRFKAAERKRMFEQLDGLLGNFVYVGSDPWTKIPKTLEPVVRALRNATETVDDLIQKNINKQEQRFKITVPSTPRYFISGSKKELSRSSKIEIYAKDQEAFDRLYVMINSTFSYLWWRIYDGGITLCKQTLLSMPVPNMSARDMKELVDEGVNMECSCVVHKMNAGKNNENIKFPDDYRKRINAFVLNDLGLSDLGETLYSMHSNSLGSVLPLWR